MRQFAAVTWKVKPGHEEELARLFADYQRPTAFAGTDEHGRETFRLIATAVFLKEDTVVRVIEFDGDLKDVLTHMASQQGVRQLEDAVDPYLQVPRDTSTQEGFQHFFQQSAMRCLVQRFADA